MNAVRWKPHDSPCCLMMPSIALWTAPAPGARNRQFGRDLLTFSIPYRMYLAMAANVEGSFLEREQWKELLDFEAGSGQ
jgi:hypothetical protein